MLKKLLTSLFTLSIIISISAQQEVAPCGTLDHRSDWLKSYQKNPFSFDKKSDTILYIPMTIHLVGSDAGTGYFSVEDLLDAFCTLNEDMASSDIVFYIEGEINYISNSAYNSHETVLEGAAMMFENNVENTLNTYFVADPAGNCGYNLPYAGIAMRKSCSAPQDHTWAHEVGHAFSLPHPFLGWEGGVSHDGSITHSFNDPAPTEVYYDYTYFLDTLIIDTMIIDTALVEYLDGSNCQEAADGFCDTAPDYISARWNCNADGMSSQTQRDPSGAQFVSDGSLIMSYADDACSYRFSDEQIAAMRANVLDEKPELLYNQTPGAIIAEETANLLFPDGDLVQYDNVEFNWEEVENATHYILQVSRLANFASAITDDFVFETNSALLTHLLDDKTYYWRVRAYNAYSFCTEFSSHKSFQTGVVSNVNNIDEITEIQIFPQLIKPLSSIYIKINSQKALQLRASLLNAAGQLVQEKELRTDFGLSNHQFEVNAIPVGLYFFQIQSETGIITQKIIAQ